jgi:hypothetical protein
MNVAYYDLRRKCFIQHRIADMNAHDARSYGFKLTVDYEDKSLRKLMPASVWCAWRDDTTNYIGVFLLDGNVPELSKSTLDYIELLATQLSLASKRVSVH